MPTDRYSILLGKPPIPVKKDAVLEDLLGALLGQIETVSLSTFVAMPEAMAIVSSHHSIGRFIRNFYELWNKETPISKYFNSIGISNPDDMSSIILTSLHRTIRGEGIRLREQIKYYQKWAEVESTPVEGTSPFDAMCNLAEKTSE